MRRCGLMASALLLWTGCADSIQVDEKGHLDPGSSTRVRMRSPFSALRLIFPAVLLSGCALFLRAGVVESRPNGVAAIFPQQEGIVPQYVKREVERDDLASEVPTNVLEA